MFLHHPNIVTHPDGYFVDIHASRGEQTGKRVAHDVGSHPNAFLFLHVFGKRAAEIVTVTVFAVLGFGMQHEGRAQTVIIANEGQELFSQRDSALLAVLKPHRGSFPEMEQPSVQIEPGRYCLDNLGASQASVKAAEQDEFKILAKRTRNKRVPECGFTETLTWPLIDAGELDPDNWTSANKPFVLAPFKEAANDHQITEGAGVRQAGAAIAVETLYISRGDVGRGNAGIEAVKERGERVGLITGRAAAVNVHLALLSHETLDQSLDTVAGRQLGSVPNLVGAGDSFREVGRFEADEFTDFGLLVGEPIDVSSEIDAATLFSHDRTVTLDLSRFAIPKLLKVRFSELIRERVTRFELATSSLAKKLPVEGTVTLRTSRSSRIEPVYNNPPTFRTKEAKAGNHLSGQNYRQTFSTNLSGGVESGVDYMSRPLNSEVCLNTIQIQGAASAVKSFSLIRQLSDEEGAGSAPIPARVNSANPLATFRERIIPHGGVEYGSETLSLKRRNGISPTKRSVAAIGSLGKKLSQADSSEGRAKSVEKRGLTHTTTITQSRWLLDGCAEDVTYPIIAVNSAPPARNSLPASVLTESGISRIPSDEARGAQRIRPVGSNAKLRGGQNSLSSRQEIGLPKDSGPGATDAPHLQTGGCVPAAQNSFAASNRTAQHRSL